MVDDGRTAARWGDEGSVRTIAAHHWMAAPVVTGYLNQRATGSPFRDWLGWSLGRLDAGDGLRALVLGCGEGWVERALATDGRFETLDACDLATDAVARARAAAEAAGLHRIRYSVRDLERDRLPGSGVDLIVAHSVLHHVEGLDRLAAEIASVARPGALLLVNEYVGAPRFQFPPAQAAAIDRIFRLLPPRCRRSAVRGDVLEAKPPPDEAEVVAADPSEAVRSDEVLPVLDRHFRRELLRPLGGGLLQHLLWEVCPSFNPGDGGDDLALALLCSLEHALEAAGRIPADFVLAVYRIGDVGGAAPSLRPAGPPPGGPVVVPAWLVPRFLAGASLDELEAEWSRTGARREGGQLVGALARLLAGGREPGPLPDSGPLVDRLGDVLGPGRFPDAELRRFVLEVLRELDGVLGG